MRERLRLGALSREEIEHKHWFVETGPARSAHFHTRQSLAEELCAARQADADRSFLLYGHGGTGKSTELVKLETELGDRFFTVRFSVKDHLDPVSFDANDLLLAIAERTLARASAPDTGLEIADQVSLRAVHDFFAEESTSRTGVRESTLAAGAGAGAGLDASGLLAGVLGLFAKFSADLRIGETHETSYVHRYKKSPGQLLAAVNHVLTAVRRACRARDRNLLLVVEDLDKLDLAPARRLFLDNTSRLRGLSACVIYTVPIFLVYSGEWNQIRRSFSRDFALPMIKVSEPAGQPCPAGRDIARTIVDQRLSDLGGAALFAPVALELAIEKTGGVLQHLLEVLYTATTVADVSLPVPASAVRAALDHRRAELWSEITIPSLAGEQMLGVERLEQLHERLAEVARQNRTGTASPANTDVFNQLLLRCHALVEYNGLRWFGVHPLVEENLVRLGRLSALPAPAAPAAD